jgi:hypothetical protein
MASKTDYFSYTDAQGTEVIVQQLNEVPAQYRAKAKHIDLSKPAFTLRAPSSQPAAARGNGVCLPGHATCFHWPSVAVGASAALVLGLAAVLLLRRARWLFWAMLGLAAVTVLSTAYLGYIRYQTSGAPAGLASPADIIGDAKRAADALKRSNEAQERLLKDIENQR